MTSRELAEERACRRAIEWEQLQHIVADYDRLLTVIARSAQIAQRKLDAGEAMRVGNHLDRILEAAARGAELSQKLLAVSRPCGEEPPDPVGLPPQDRKRPGALPRRTTTG